MSRRLHRGTTGNVCGRWIRRIFCCLLMTGSILLSGCWDRIEINDLAIIFASAYDREDNLYRVSVQLPLPGQMGASSGGGGGTGGSVSYYIDSEVGYTIREASHNLQMRMSRQLFSAHRRVIIISEEIAREGVRDIFDIATRTHDNRLTTYLIVAKGEAWKLLQAQPQFERFSGEAIRELAKSQHVIPVSMRDLAQAMNTSGKDAIALYMSVVPSEKSTDASDEVTVSGYVQFRDDKMVDIFDPEKDYGLYWLKNERNGKLVSFPWRDHYVSLQVQNAHVHIRPKVDEHELFFQIDAWANGYLTEDLSDEDLRLQKNLHQLDKALAEEIEQSIRHCIDKIQRNRADSAGFGTIVHRNYPRLWEEKYKQDWGKHLQSARFAVNVRAKIERIGLTTNNITVKGEHQ